MARKEGGKEAGTINKLHSEGEVTTERKAKTKSTSGNTSRGPYGCRTTIHTEYIWPNMFSLVSPKKQFIVYSGLYHNILIHV